MVKRELSEQYPSANHGLSSTDQQQTIIAERLTKSYAGMAVLKGVSFSLWDGEFLTLLGPSGSGKSTTLGIIAGFVELSHGDVRVGERSIASLPPRSRNFGIVFQNYALFPHMTVESNVAFGLRMRGVPRKERRRRTHEMLERVELGDLAQRTPTELSGGQQQRVALARALIIDPTALLLDEPLGALDRRLRQQMGLKLKDVQKQSGVSVLYVTHDQEEAMVMSDRLAVMHNGSIEQIDTPMNVYKYPKTRFVAKFLGEVNLFDVTVEELHGDRCLVRFADGSLGRVHVSETGTGGRPGQRAVVCIRPERLRFVHGPCKSENVISGTLSSNVYLGSTFRYDIQALDVKAIVTTPDIEVGSCTAIEPGTSVQLGWNAEDAHVLFED